VTDEAPLTPEQRRVLASAMDRVLPEGRGPSAGDLGAIDFADWLTRQPDFAPNLGVLRSGLALLDTASVGTTGRPFAACDATQQDAVLRALHDAPHPTVQRFLRLLVRLTLAGAFSPPAYGGNRGGAGWRYIGYEPRPPTPDGSSHGGNASR
jgi:gluconate 2-dehydrogenase subunit 3-like protein